MRTINSMFVYMDDLLKDVFSDSFDRNKSRESAKHTAYA